MKSRLVAGAVMAASLVVGAPPVFATASPVVSAATLVQSIEEVQAMVGTQGTAVFQATGAPQTYTVPDNVTQILVQVVGGGGGSMSAAGTTSAWAQGGVGSEVLTYLDVTPGQVIQVDVGGVGGPSSTDTTAQGGWNGGATSSSPGGGGGGGASDLRICATAAAGTCGPNAAVVVAGGGGGAGAGLSSAGGNANTPSGPDQAGGGGGGSTSAGGGAGFGGCGTGESGSKFQGGAGSVSWPDNSSTFGGGGGGGGYFGGGGGACGMSSPSDPSSGAGGGGSSWVDTELTSNTSYSIASTYPQAGWVVFQGLSLGSTGWPVNITVPMWSSVGYVVATGASGGTYNDVPGGGGAQVGGSLAVSPASTLQVLVGGGGVTGGSNAYVNNLPLSGTGYNGGAGLPSGNNGVYNYEAGGGGATDLRICANAGSGTCPLSSRQFVAAGGGGSATYDIWHSAAPGGAGGCAEGAAGDGANTSAGAGGGGTQSAGGSGGSPSSSDGDWGQAGALGQGGMGGIGDDAAYNSYNGSGGGGGYYGGGGGGGGGGSGDNLYHSPGPGGGGSSLVPAGTTCTQGTVGVVGGATDGSLLILFPSELTPAPTGVSATAGGIGQSIVSWTPPTPPDLPGISITGYEVRYSTDSGVTWNYFNTPIAGTASSAIVTGLAANTGYVFDVAALSGPGRGPWSAATAPITTAAPPATPGMPTAVGSQPGRVPLRWTLPLSPGGAPITGYSIRSSSDSGTSWTIAIVDTQSTNLFTTVTGLTNGVTYIFEVAAVNGAGTGAWSDPSSPVMPVGLPSRPATPTTSVGDNEFTVSWSAPIDGGVPITAYVVTIAGQRYTFSGTTLSHTVTKTRTNGQIVNGTQYRASVTAVNSFGSSVASPMSAAVVPGHLPYAPQTVAVATMSASSARLTWSGAAQSSINGGWNVIGYRVRVWAGGEIVQTLTTSNAASRQVLVTGLTLGTTYTYTVEARCGNGFGRTGSSSPAVLAVKPAAPSNFTALGGPGTISALWSAPPDAGAPISYLLSLTRSGTVISSVSTPEVEYQFVGLQAGTYRLKLSASDIAGISPVLAIMIKAQ